MSSETPYTVLMDTLEAIGERDDTDLPSLERVRTPWESRMQATCECLSWRGALDTLERRQAEDLLGETVYRRFPVYTRSALAVAHALMDKGVFTESELRSKMAELRIRFGED
ncbi:ScnB [Microbispora rosea]|uniref:ScnB n=1 Tax=Microbispora rosea TaxID=58117 RepID=UPI0036D2057D